MMPKFSYALMSWALGGLGVCIISDWRIYVGVGLMIISQRIWLDGFK